MWWHPRNHYSKQPAAELLNSFTGNWKQSCTMSRFGCLLVILVCLSHPLFLVLGIRLFSGALVKFIQVSWHWKSKATIIIHQKGKELGRLLRLPHSHVSLIKPDLYCPSVLLWFKSLEGNIQNCWYIGHFSLLFSRKNAVAAIVAFQHFSFKLGKKKKTNANQKLDFLVGNIHYFWQSSGAPLLDQKSLNLKELNSKAAKCSMI